jgi:hypothetical protein
MAGGLVPQAPRSYSSEPLLPRWGSTLFQASAKPVLIVTLNGVTDLSVLKKPVPGPAPGIFGVRPPGFGCNSPGKLHKIKWLKDISNW